MKITTRYGDFAFACVRIDDRVDTGMIEVRAGTTDEFAALRSAFPKLAFFEVEACGESECSLRTRVPKNLWSTVMGRLVLEMDYADSVFAENGIPVGKTVSEAGCMQNPLYMKAGA